MDPRLKKLEAIEGIKNLFRLFSIPMAMAERDTRSRKGNMMEVIRAVSSCLPGTREKSGDIRETISFEKNMPEDGYSPHQNQVSAAITLLASFQVGPLPCLLR